VLDGNVTAEHGNKGTQKPSEKLKNAKIWMSEYCKMVGDKMPPNDQVHLPSYESRKAVYELYKEEMKAQLGEDSNQIIAMTTFYKMWKTDFSFVKIPKVRKYVAAVIVHLCIYMHKICIL